MNNLPQVVKFNKQDVPVFFHNEKPYVAMKPICENIGLQWEAQYKKIQRNHILKQAMSMMDMPSKGGVQQTIALPIGFLNGWLLSIDVNRVKPEIKDTLIKYQLECYDVLYNHFMPKVATAHPNTITVEQQQAIKDAVSRKVRRDGKHYQAVYAEFYREFNIPRYQELPLSRFDEALNWLGDGFVQPKVNILEQLRQDIYNICIQALSSNEAQIQLLHNINISFHSDSISNNISLLRKENREILDFSRKYELQSKNKKPLVSDSGYVSFYHGCGGFTIDKRYFKH